MKVLFDTNVFISYLLHPDKEGAIQKILEAGFEGRYTILLPQLLIDELQEKLTTKSYLKKYIPPESAQHFIIALRSVAQTISAITEPIPAICRDKKDDFLLAYAFVGGANYLVSGDRDLLVVGHIEKIKIVNPKDFFSLIS
jgi:uncharacterized protein